MDIVGIFASQRYPYKNIPINHIKMTELAEVYGTTYQ